MLSCLKKLLNFFRHCNFNGKTCIQLGSRRFSKEFSQMNVYKILNIWHKILGNPHRLGKNGLHIPLQQEKSYRNDELFFFGIWKSFKNAGQLLLAQYSNSKSTSQKAYRFRSKILGNKTPFDEKQPSNNSGWHLHLVNILSFS